MIDVPVVVVGSGGHARVVVEALLASGAEVGGLVTRDETHWGTIRYGVPVLGDDSRLEGTDVVLANGVGSVGDCGPRTRAYTRLREAGFTFPFVAHPSATLSPTARLGDAVQLHAGVVVQAGTVLGDNVVVNTSASIDHDCVVSDHAFVAPGAVICASVRVGTRSHVGAGAVLIQGVHIGEDVIVGAGAVVLASVPDGVTVVGNPARVLPKR